VFNAYSAYFYSGHVFVSPKEAITANREYKDNIVAGLFFDLEVRDGGSVFFNLRVYRKNHS
jgi:hypothetical protein